MTSDVMFREAKNFFQVFEPKGEIISGIMIPGSVRILGDTSVLNKGKVIAGNLNKSAFIMAQKRRDGDRAVNFYSQRYDEKIRLSLNEPQSRQEHGWANFIASTLFMLESMSKKVNGMNVYINNSIPDEFAANSMEALEVGSAKISGRFSDWELENDELADICAQGEASFIGKEKDTVKYLPIIYGKTGALTYLDLAKKDSRALETPMGDYVFLVFSSGVKKKQLEEKKNKIIEDVKDSLEKMKKNGFGDEGLESLTLEGFDDYRDKLTLVQRKRCAYFISENERVEKAMGLLQKKDFDGFAEVINESQKNIKNRLELVEEENEILIDIIQDSPEIKAVRLLNMGLDGTVLSLVLKEKRKAVETKIKKTFLSRTGLELKTEVFGLETEMRNLDIDVTEFNK
ncbi:MAG TPA: hypothetical protein ENN55_00665 [Firmicutes bacterium]|nr:hypothetical protein [Bacillota bacterium]